MIQEVSVLKPLAEDNNVCIRDALKDKWLRKAKVIRKNKSPPSDIVKTEIGNHLQRNQSHLLLTKESSLINNMDDKINDCDLNESDRNDTSS